MLTARRWSERADEVGGAAAGQVGDDHIDDAGVFLNGDIAQRRDRRRVRVAGHADLRFSVCSWEKVRNLSQRPIHMDKD
jgi:hypothetical protein